MTRPIRIWKETWILEASFSVFNVFNNAPRGNYAGLGGSCGSLNFDYLSEPVNDPDACNVGALDRVRGLPDRIGRRQLQFGIRFSF